MRQYPTILRARFGDVRLTNPSFCQIFKSHARGDARLDARLAVFYISIYLKRGVSFEICFIRIQSLEALRICQNGIFPSSSPRSPTVHNQHAVCLELLVFEASKSNDTSWHVLCVFANASLILDLCSWGSFCVFLMTAASCDLALIEVVFRSHCHFVLSRSSTIALQEVGISPKLERVFV